MTEPLRLLVVEDRHEDLLLLQIELERNRLPVRAERVDTEEGLRTALAKGRWHAVLADFHVPGLPLTRTLTLLREHAPHLPCIVVSGAVDEESAVEALQAGAADFVSKDRLARLAPALRREVAEAQRRHEDAVTLQESELRFQSVVESLGEGVLITDLEDRILHVNPSLEALYGYPAEEMLGRRAHQLLLTEEQWPAVHRRHQERARGTSERYEATVRHRDGSIRHVAIQASPLRDAQGSVIGTVNAHADLTERVQAQREIEALNERLRHAAEAYRDLAAFSADIEMVHDVETLVRMGLERLTRGLGMEVAGFYDVGDTRMDLAYRYGPVPEAIVRAPRRPGWKEHALVGRVARSGEPAYVRDYRNAPGALEDAVRAGLRSTLALPVYAGDGVRHVLSLASLEREVSLDDEDLAVAKAFVRRLENALERARQIEEVTATREATFRSLGTALEYRDYETRGHTDRVASLAVRFGRAMDFDRDGLQALQWGAYLHDVGKIAISDAILLKPGRLSEEEYAAIKAHADFGAAMTRDIPFLPQASRDLVRHHHERWDGSGYPDGLAGEEIPLEARMFSLVDVWDALTQERPYKRAWPEDEALEELRRQRGTQFDPSLVDVFLPLIARESTAD